MKVLAAPVAAPVADTILREAGFRSRSEQDEEARHAGIMAGEQEAAAQQAAQEQAMQAQQAQEQAMQAKQAQQAEREADPVTADLMRQQRQQQPGMPGM